MRRIRRQSFDFLLFHGGGGFDNSEKLNPVLFCSDNNTVMSGMLSAITRRGALHGTVSLTAADEAHHDSSIHALMFVTTSTADSLSQLINRFR